MEMVLNRELILCKELLVSSEKVMKPKSILMEWLTEWMQFSHRQEISKPELILLLTLLAEPRIFSQASRSLGKTDSPRFKERLESKRQMLWDSTEKEES